jgi:hypothetical protein
VKTPAPTAGGSGATASLAGPAKNVADAARALNADAIATRASTLPDAGTCEATLASFRVLVNDANVLPVGPSNKTNLRVAIESLRRALSSACHVPEKDLP